MGYAKIILSVDFSDEDSAVRLIRDCSRYIGMVKLGLEFFIANGPSGVRRIFEMGIPIFLDLKLHDIPNTVAEAIRSIDDLLVYLTTVHIAGGKEMLKAAFAAAAEKGIEIAGVTKLTSIESSIEDVISMASVAYEVGVRHFVCSAKEVSQMKNSFPDAKIIVPGIRLEQDEKQDQCRTATPAEAIRNGADYIVLGRTITSSPNPIEKLRMIIDELRRITCPDN